jgi:hypothetical protein
MAAPTSASSFERISARKPRAKRWEAETFGFNDGLAALAGGTMISPIEGPDIASQSADAGKLEHIR